MTPKKTTTPEYDSFSGNGFYGRIAVDALVPIGDFLEIGTSAIIGNNYSRNFEPALCLILNYTF